MTISSAAALAAAEAAARRAAEAEARRIAAEQAELAAQQAAEQAEEPAPLVAAPIADELSTGQGSTALLRANTVTGAADAPEQLGSDAPTYSVTGLQHGAV